MNPEPTPTPREQTEMRLTALLMGELSAEETVALHAQIAADPGLARLHARLRQAMELLREATAEPEPATPTPAQLSSERRERLLAHFQNPAPQPAKPAPIIKAPRRNWSWVVPLGAAAAVVVILAGLLFPAMSGVQQRASRSAESSRTLADSATNTVIGQIRGEDEIRAGAEIKSSWASQPGQLRTFDNSGQASRSFQNYRVSSEPVPDLHSISLAPADKSKATALYLPPTTDAPSGGEAPQIQLPGATIAKAGDGTQALSFNDLNAPVTRDAVPPRPTNTADSKLNRMGGLGGMGMGVGIGGIGGTGTGGPGALYLPPTTDALASGEPAAEARLARSVDGLKRGQWGLRPMGEADPTIVAKGQEIPIPEGLALPEIRKHPDDAKDARVAQNREAVEGWKADKGGFIYFPTLDAAATPAEPAPSVVGFDGFANFGSPIVPAPPADPAAPAPPGLLSLSDGPAAIKIVRESDYRSPLAPPQKPAAESAGWDDDADPRRPTHKAGGERVNLPKSQKALPTADPGDEKVDWLYESIDEFQFQPKAAAKAKGDQRHFVMGELRVEHARELLEEAGLEATDSREKKKEPAKPAERAVAPFGDADDLRDAQPAPAPAPLAAKPPPPPSEPLPVVTAPAVAELKKEVAIQPRQPEELLKKIDEAVLLDRDEKNGRQAGKEQQAFARVLDALDHPMVDKAMEATAAEAVQPATEALKLDPAKVGAQLEVKPDKAPAARRSPPAMTPAPVTPQSEVAAKIPAPLAAARQSQMSRKQELVQAQKAASMDEELPAARPAQPAAIPQPEVATSANAFSTFSLNVSDVSFKLAGASLEKGQMPELATVRSEEFINAFDYRDPEPAAGAPLAFATERARYPFAQNRDLVRFSVKTAAAGRQPGRPLNLVLLLDNSGSMERADRVRILREALRVLAAQLQPQDRLSVVAFARTPRLWADGVSGDKAAEAVTRVGEITPQGGTNLEAALDLGYATALKHYQPGSISRVVLLTDGAANLGDVNPDALKRKVETNRQRGVALDCFGIGWEGYDDTLLETLARNGDGRYGFINTPGEAASGFAAQLAGALRVAASDAKVQVEWNPRRVTAYRQIGYAKHQLKKEQFRDNSVDAAEIGAAESGNALYVVEVNPHGEGDLATVRVRFKVPGTSDYKEHEWPVPFTKDAPSLEQASPALRLAGTASAFSEWLVASPYAAEITTDRLLGLLNGVPAHYPADPRPKKLEWMIRTAKSVSGR